MARDGSAGPVGDEAAQHGARRPRRGPGWNAAIPFLLLLLAIAYIPYASQRAAVQGALEREESRHALLVRHVAQRVQEQGEMLEKTLSHLANMVAVLGVHAPDAVEEMDATWRLLSSYFEVIGLAFVDDGLTPVIRRGVASPEDPETWPGVAGVVDLAMRRGSDTQGTLWESGIGGLHLTLATPVRDAEDRAIGALVTVVDLEHLIDRLFQGGTRDHGVSFTVMASDGSVLLHSGLAMSSEAATRDPTSCRSCHEGHDIRERVRSPRPGSGIHAISGRDRVVAFAPVSIGRQEWTISASTPVQEVLRPVAQQTIVSMFFTLAVVILLVGLGLLIRQGQIRRIRLEEELASQHKMLALAREKERLAQEVLASRRLSSIGEMVARVAHEVKNPLQYIGTGVDLLREHVREEPAAGLLRDIRTGVQTLDAIVQELLDFSRPMRLERVPVDLNDLAREAASRVVPPEVPVTLDLAPDLPEVQADGYKLRQVIENLLRNAVESLVGPARSNRIVLATRADEGGVRIGVRDTGVGIAPADIERVFEPFYTSKTSGSGLGLPVVQRIVEAHGGSVRVESRPGEGTLVEVWLPRAARGEVGTARIVAGK